MKSEGTIEAFTVRLNSFKVMNIYSKCGGNPSSNVMTFLKKMYM